MEPDEWACSRVSHRSCVCASTFKNVFLIFFGVGRTTTTVMCSTGHSTQWISEEAEPSYREACVHAFVHECVCALSPIPIAFSLSALSICVMPEKERNCEVVVAHICQAMIFTEVTLVHPCLASSQSLKVGFRLSAFYRHSNDSVCDCGLCKSCSLKCQPCLGLWLHCGSFCFTACNSGQKQCPLFLYFTDKPGGILSVYPSRNKWNNLLRCSAANQSPP